MKKKTKTAKIPRNMTLDPVTIRRAEALAVAQNRSVSSLAETLIDDAYVRTFGKRKVAA